MPNVGEKWKRKSDDVIFIISNERYGKGARYVELEPEETDEIIWLMDSIVELDYTQFISKEYERLMGILRIKMEEDKKKNCSIKDCAEPVTGSGDGKPYCQVHFWQEFDEKYGD